MTAVGSQFAKLNFLGNSPLLVIRFQLEIAEGSFLVLSIDVDYFHAFISEISKSFSTKFGPYIDVHDFYQKLICACTMLNWFGLDFSSLELKNP